MSDPTVAAGGAPASEPPGEVLSETPPTSVAPRWFGLDRAALLVGALATLVRLVWVAALARIPTGLSDPFVYWGYGIRIANGRGYRSIVEGMTSYYPPGYPHLIGAVYWLLDVTGLEGWPAWPVGTVQSVMWGVTAVAVVLVGRMLFDARVGLVAGLLVAVWPNLIAYAAAFLSESFFVMCFSLYLLGIIAAVVEWRGPAPRRSTLAGSVTLAALSLGVATMVRPQVLLSVPVVALVWLVCGVGWRRTAAVLAASAVGVGLFVVPWGMRNVGVFGHFVPVSTNTGDNLCVGFHPGALGGFAIPEECETGEFWTDGPAAEYRRDQETRALAWKYITADPGALPWLSVKKMYYTYRSDEDGLAGMESYGADPILSDGWRTAWKVAANAFYAVVMVAMLAGIVTRARQAWAGRDPAVLTAAALTVVGAFVPILFFGDTRFKVPTTPLFALFAAAALAPLVRDHVAPRLRRSAGPRPPG